MVAAALDRLGRVHRLPPVVVDADRALDYAQATNDDNPAYATGRCLPPLFGVVPAWPAFLAVVADTVPDESLPRLLHAAHDMRFHRPLAAGATLTTVARLSGVRTARAGAWMTIALESRLGDGELALTQVATLFVRGLSGGGNGGDAAPAHPFPASARAAMVAEVPLRTDADQAKRYAAASGDNNAIHLDDEAARAAGLPGVILHGLCTMAMCGRAVVAAAAADDPSRLRRLALRFSNPVFPGADLVTRVYRADEPAVFAFEATSGEERTVKDGLAEVAG